MISSNQAINIILYTSQQILYTSEQRRARNCCLLIKKRVLKNMYFLWAPKILICFPTYSVIWRIFSFLKLILTSLGIRKIVMWQILFLRSLFTNVMDFLKNLSKKSSETEILEVFFDFCGHPKFSSVSLIIRVILVLFGGFFRFLK